MVFWAMTVGFLADAGVAAQRPARNDGCGRSAADVAVDPYTHQAREKAEELRSDAPAVRARAAEALGYLRYYPAEAALVAALSDPDARVRRNAALALAWCGSRASLAALVDRLGDPDWTVRQSAWVALTNLTGMEHPFDALADRAERERDARVWRAWVAALPARGLPEDVIALLVSGRHHEVERGVRAAGALGADADVVGRIARAIGCWAAVEDEADQEAKWRVQAGLRALGRSGRPEGLPTLVEFLHNAQWSRYAADALGDLGGEGAAEALVEAFPRYARPAGPQLLQESTHRAPGTHPSDAPHLDSRDRILAAPYAIALSLSRSSFHDPGALARLRAHAPLLVAQIPLDIDGLMVYDEEPFQGVFRHLLEQVGARQSLLDVAFATLGEPRSNLDPAPEAEAEVEVLSDPAYASNVVLALCRDSEDVPRLIALLDHENLWVRINATRTLMFLGASEAVEAIGERLRASPPEAEYGFFNAPYFARAQGQDEFNDPAPRYREAFVVALGWFRAEAYQALLTEILFDERNALGILHRAAMALDRIDTAEALAALREAELAHPYHSVRMVAREALWRRGAVPKPRPEPPAVEPPRVAAEDIPGRATRFVFIKGDPVPYNPFQMDSWRQAYMTTDSGPTYRPGRNLYVLDRSNGEPVVTPLTTFAEGYVADCEVSYDGRTVWFSRRREDSPWWHLYAIQADGTGLRQVTDGPYHDVQPAVMPNGRIAFSTTRLGTRDEYHGYLCTGLATLHPDGSDIRVIGFNFGRDAEPAIADDGRILFTRIELFYSRMKTEANLLAAYPDGTRMNTLYGPERRGLWSGIHGGYGSWARSGDRHRQLRLVQPQAYRPGEYLLTTPAGPILTQGRAGERFLRGEFLGPGGNDPWAVTTPYRLDNQTLLVAAGRKNQPMVNAEFPRDAVDLGLYTLCVDTGELTLLYNDPATADFEARPLHPRRVPPVLVESPAARQGGFTGTLYANSVFISQEPNVAKRGKLLRVVEALPQVTRHATHTTPGEHAWKNHGGAFGRDLVTLSLAADGAFAVRAPADRPLHLQVLDSDRNVVGNQLVWMHLRPGEVKGCIGCHEPPQWATPPPATTPAFSNLRVFQAGALPDALPYGPDQPRYRAKIWFKGHVPQEREERQRTVQSINLFGR